MPKNVKKILAKRLLPLYIAAFFHGFVLWYTIEKLFMSHIGFDSATIGVMVALYSTVMLVAETPSGILADRWSRKGVLILASIALALSSLIGGISDSITVYLWSSALWGLFFALYSGTYDSIVYDTVWEETGNSRTFERFYGRINIADSIALVSSSLAGGVIASLMGLRAAYFLTIPFALLAVVALVKFKEPKLHKMHVATSIKEHVRTTFRGVLSHKELLPLILVLVLVSTLTYMIFSFSQLWLIALAVPTVFFGTANAALLSSTGVGGAIASACRIYRYPVMLVVLGIMLTSSLSLIVFRNPIIIVVGQVLFATALFGIAVVFKRLLHDLLSPQIRAGATSAISTLSLLCIIPLALVFGLLSKEWDVFNAAWLLLVLGVVVSAVILVLASKNGGTGLEPK